MSGPLWRLAEWLLGRLFAVIDWLDRRRDGGGE